MLHSGATNANDVTLEPYVSPISAVEFAWAITAKFSRNPQTASHGVQVESDYKNALKDFKKMIDNCDSRDKQKHCEYYGTLVSSMVAAIKNIETYLRYRDIRTDERKKLGEEKVQSINRMKQFGLSFENAFPKIASSAAIGGVSGLTLTGLLSDLHLSPLQQNILILAFLGIGYLVTEFVVMPLTIRSTKRALDEINSLSILLYDLYIQRCRDELEDLFSTLLGSYKEAYGKESHIPEIDGRAWTVDEVLPVNQQGQVFYSKPVGLRVRTEGAIEMTSFS